MKRWILILCLSMSWLSSLALAAGALTPTELRCEYRAAPLGIDAARPRLSWVLRADSERHRGLRQTAYQVIVATSAKKLATSEGDLWDSGQVQSDQSIHVQYAGQPPRSGQECFWKVRVWDQQGKASAWSQPAKWTMGLLKPTDWKGQWIGKDEVEKPSTLAGTQWIWFPEGKPEATAPVGTRWFRRVVNVPEGRVIKRAQALMTADNEFVLNVNGKLVGSGNNFHAAADFDVTGALRAGANVLAVLAKNAGESANPAGLVGLLRVEFAQGEPLIVATDESWRASNKEATGWEQPGFDDSGWVAAQKLGPVGMAPWGEVSGSEDRRLAARWLRKEFQVERKVRRATAYVSGLGLSELYPNGKKVGDHVLSPGLTEYPKRVFYVTHDVTGHVKRGANALGVVLGNGRYFAPRLKVPTETRTYGYPKLLLQLNLEFEDGSTTSVVSDESWKLTTDGPIRANCEYDGEEYDARMELDGWAEPGFDDAKWEKVQLVSSGDGTPPQMRVGAEVAQLGPLFRNANMSAQMIEPIRVTETLKPISVTEQSPGVWIFDFGQNMVGWCRLRVRGPRGTEVTLRHAETLRPDGSLYLDNIRSAKVTDTYILRGQGTETWEPRFTYHGFRYVELKGFPGRPDRSTLEGRVVNDDLELAGDWSCSNPLLNRIYRNIFWGVRGNYRSIVTDCPQRDERQGWLGDRSSESKGETYLFNTAALYGKWLQDMADAQKDNGSVSDVCPAYWPFYSDNVTWPSSTVIIPGALLDQFGDSGLIERHYPSMKKWVDYMAGFIKDDVMPRDTYGDWCVPPEDPKLIHSKDPLRKTHGTIMGTTYFFHCCQLMARYATLLGQSDDAQHYRGLAARLKAGFNKTFLKPDGSQYDNGSQTSCVLPLAFGLVPDEHRSRIFSRLVDKITGETKNHIGTGLVGGQWLMRTLSDNGRADLAYTLASNRDYPSWGYMVENGATTIWELWNGDTADPAMNSGNHVMLVGDLVIWLYEYLAGIRPDPEQPGFKHIVMKPHAVGDLTWVKARHRSPYGLIASEWKQEGDAFKWNITVPPNTTATVYVPARDLTRVTESERPIKSVRQVKFLRMEEEHALFAVGSGRYQFASR
ncbi:MAG: family 78 glycoside hydrolase catalytic domain [Verrucomicrobia bacterium]|nr:family 78 glycoside hydrolase catalytic domain [Verrucomicrobiota bacterium]